MDLLISTSIEIYLEKVRLTLSLGLIKHDPAHIFNVLHFLSLKELDNVTDDFLLNPDEY